MREDFFDDPLEFLAIVHVACTWKDEPRNNHLGQILLSLLCTVKNQSIALNAATEVGDRHC